MGFREMIGIGGSAGTVFSYRMPTRLASYLKLARRSVGCRAFPNLGGNMAFLWSSLTMALLR